MSWEKWRPIIVEQRVRYMGPNYLEHWEYLATVLRSIQNRRGDKVDATRNGL